MKRSMIALALLILMTSFAPQLKPLLWTAIGDSITYMNEHQDETNNRTTKGYMTMVTEKLPHIKYINKGYNGWTAGGIAENMEKLGLVKSDIYSVFLGTNDWWRGRPLGILDDYKEGKGNGTVFGSFRIIIDKLRSLNPDAKIILITPMQRADFVYLKDMKNNAWGSYKEKNGQSLARFADAVNAIGQYDKLTVVDLFNEKGLGVKHLVKYKRLKDPQTGSYQNFRYPDFIDVPFDPAKDVYPYPLEAMDITYDGLHPSDKGYRIIAKMLTRVIGK